MTVDAQSASITAIGPCGALISGLEDEYSDVRAAAINSCYDISCCHDVFQSKLVEYIVSMFDDDIEHVRLQAMRVLGKIAQGRVLRGEQVLSILTELLVRALMERLFSIRSFFLSIRAALTIFVLLSMTSYVSYASAIQTRFLNYSIGSSKTFNDSKPTRIQSFGEIDPDQMNVILSLLIRCLRELGQNNSAYIALLLPRLLPMHSYLDVQEPQFSKIDRLSCSSRRILHRENSS